MAKKAAATGDRKDPHKNISLAIRMVLANMPKAKAKEVVEAVKKEYGHTITQNRVYMVKTKRNMAASAAKSKRAASAAPAAAQLSSPGEWVKAIRLAKQLLEASGSVSNAAALLNAVGS